MTHQEIPQPSDIADQELLLKYLPCCYWLVAYVNCPSGVDWILARFCQMGQRTTPDQEPARRATPDRLKHQDPTRHTGNLRNSRRHPQQEATALDSEPASTEQIHSSALPPGHEVGVDTALMTFSQRNSLREVVRTKREDGRTKPKPTTDRRKAPGKTVLTTRSSTSPEALRWFPMLPHSTSPATWWSSSPDCWPPTEGLAGTGPVPPSGHGAALVP